MRTKKGYGMVRWEDRGRNAHCIAWERTNGPIPDGLHVLHHCDVRYPKGSVENRRCVNPAHLWLGTNAQNNADMMQKGRNRSLTGDEHPARLHPERMARGEMNGAHTHPDRVPRGDRHGSRTHPEKLARGEMNGNVKLTEADIPGIFAASAVGETQSSIARRLGVSRPTIGLVLSGRTWRHPS
jgi:hypothetical protein